MKPGVSIGYKQEMFNKDGSLRKKPGSNPILSTKEIMKLTALCPLYTLTAYIFVTVQGVYGYFSFDFEVRTAYSLFIICLITISEDSLLFKMKNKNAPDTF